MTKVQFITFPSPFKLTSSRRTDLVVFSIIEDSVENIQWLFPVYLLLFDLYQHVGNSHHFACEPCQHIENSLHLWCVLQFSIIPAHGTWLI